MQNVFNLSKLLALETASDQAFASGNAALVEALQEPLADMDVAALERVPESRDEMRDLLKLAHERSTAATRKAVALCLTRAEAGEFGVKMLVALRVAIVLAENDPEDPIYVRLIATNVLRAMTTLTVVSP